MSWKTVKICVNPLDCNLVQIFSYVCIKIHAQFLSKANDAHPKKGCSQEVQEL